MSIKTSDMYLRFDGDIVGIADNKIGEAVGINVPVIRPNATEWSSAAVKELSITSLGNFTIVGIALFIWSPVPRLPLVFNPVPYTSSS